MADNAFPIPALLEEHIAELESLCMRYRVRTLDLIGSAATGAFDAETSDLDFLVEFEPTVRGVYFDLLVELECLFGRRPRDGVRNAQSVLSPVGGANANSDLTPERVGSPPTSAAR